MIFETSTTLDPLKKYSILEKKLGDMGRKIEPFRKKDVSTLKETIMILENRIYETRMNSGFMDFVSDTKYISDIYTKSALECLVEYKENRNESVVLVPGMTYYNAKLLENEQEISLDDIKGTFRISIDGIKQIAFNTFRIIRKFDPTHKYNYNENEFAKQLINDLTDGTGYKAEVLKKGEENNRHEAYWWVEVKVSKPISEKRIVGKKCHYLNEDTAYWIPLNEDERILKATEIMTWGSDAHFRKIYFELADGTLFENFTKYNPKHITKSSNKALNAIAKYCDSLWEGKWPWEVGAPSKLKQLIKENTNMTKQSVRVYREQFNKLRDRLIEGEIEKSEMITQMQGYVEDIDNMLEKFGRIAGSLFTDMKQEVKSQFGDSAADSMETVLSDKIKSVSGSLGDLKSAWQGEIDKLISGDVGGPAEFDAPVDPMAGELAGGELGGEGDDIPDLAGGDVGGEEGDEFDIPDFGIDDDELGAEREKK